MAQETPAVFADGVMSVTLANSVVRIYLGVSDAENKLQPAGTLIIPLNQLAPTVQNLANATNDLLTKAREAQAKAGEAAGGGNTGDETKLA